MISVLNAEGTTVKYHQENSNTAKNDRKAILLKNLKASLRERILLKSVEKESH